jgi:hypothetical protein
MIASTEGSALWNAESGHREAVIDVEDATADELYCMTTLLGIDGSRFGFNNFAAMREREQDRGSKAASPMRR